MALTRPRYSQIYDTDYKQSVRVATTADVGNLLATGNMTNTIDGVSLVLLDRILVKDQVDTKQNGIYRVLTVGTGSNGTWGRTLDADADDKMTAGMTTIVSEGSNNANKTFRLATPDPIVVGTTELTFVDPFAGGSAAGGNTHVQFNDGGTVGASSGFAFNKVGNVLSVGGNINVTGSILPTANVEYDLGSPTLRWRDGYFSGNTIDLGGATISVHPTNGFTFTSPGTDAVALGGSGSLSSTITTANVNLKGYVDGEISTTTSAITTANVNLKGYVDQANTIQSNQIAAVSNSVIGANAAIVTANTNMKGYTDNLVTTANTNLKGYVDGEIATTTSAITTANTNLKGYVDAANTIQSNQIAGANAAITTANTNMKGYVDGQITDLVGGSPETLDTLNEIAAALGNDANLSTTLTNLISGVQGNVTAANSAIITANTNMKGYVDGEIATTTSAITTANTNMKGYVDAANTIQSSQITAVSSSVTGANAAIVTANTNMKGYVDSVANLSSYSDANVTAYLPTHSGNVGAASVNATNLFGTIRTAAQTNITQVGTLTSGTWNAGIIDSTYGGTGVNNGGRTLTVNTNSGTISFTGAATTLTVAAAASVSGTNTGDQTSVSGNAGSATVLQTARLLNGVSFDGSQNITVPTNLGITAGTTAGPIVTSSSGTNATLPTASGTASGVVTTDAQTWAGNKTFTDITKISQLLMGDNTFVRDFASGYSTTHTPTNPQEIGRITFTGNFQNITIIGEIRGASGASVGVTRFILDLRSNTLPSKSFTLFEEETTNLGRLINVRVYQDTASGLVVIGYSSNDQLQNIGWSLKIQERGNYNYFQQVNTLTAINLSGLTEVVTTSTVKTMSGSLVAGGTVTAPTFSGALIGNASSATILQTARLLNGVSFNGSADITVPTNLGITAGTTAGPVVTSSSGTNATLPTASATASGVVTTGAQTWAGLKTIGNSEFRIGNSNTENYISFRGTTGDGPGSFNHTYIGEYLYGGTESSELLLFKGNDVEGSPGPDRIRHIAANHLFQTYTSALSGTFTAVASSASPQTRMIIRQNGNVGIGTDNPGSKLDVAGTGNFTETVTVPSITKSGTNGVGDIGQSGNSFNTVFAKATSAQYADLAEIYSGDRDYIPATVVVFGGDKEVTVSLISHDPSVAGVVSTNPAYLMNDQFEGVAVALQGRVPCRVLGPVNKGDRVVTSGVRGVAERLDMSKYQPGCIIGKALDYVPEGEIATIEVVVGRN